jgi:hypothetical protein
VGKYRGGPKPWEKSDAQGRRLDPGHYTELNAMFYNADPGEFIKMRIEALSLMVCADEQLAPAFGVDRIVATPQADAESPQAVATFGAMEPPDESARKRYLRMESVMIAHHASEAFLRLFFAHVDHEECPWLGMSASTNFADFKKQVADTLKQGFDRADIATVFLGGETPADAGIELSADEFDDAIGAIDLLLNDAGARVVTDSFLYNAVKHGVTAIAVDDDEAQFAFHGQGGGRTVLHKGPVHVYLHKAAFPNAPKSEPEWFYSAADSNPARELSVSTLISKAIDSLWAVARRRYLGATTSIIYIPKAEVEMAIYGITMLTMNRMARITSELIKVKPDGTVDGTTHRMSMYEIPKEWSLEAAATGPQPSSRTVALPARQRDQQFYSMGALAYMPLTPRGFQRG